MHPLVRDLTGQQFGRLTVVEHVGTGPSRRASWRCTCQCGGSIVVGSNLLLNGKTRSCGCLAQESARDLCAKHGHVGLPEYWVWHGIQLRCSNASHPGYLTHGGRGITMDERWASSFDAFVADVGERPSPQHRLIRLDPTGHFEPENCAWMTRAEQGKLHSNYTRHKK